MSKNVFKPMPGYLQIAKVQEGFVKLCYEVIGVNSPDDIFKVGESVLIKEEDKVEISGYLFVEETKVVAYEGEE